MKIIIQLLTIFITLSINSIYAQSTNYIDSLTISPANSTSADEIKVICYSSFPQSGCLMDSFNLTISNIEINIEAYHSIGDATRPCKSSDTISLGRLSSGNYKLNYKIRNIGVTEKSDVDSVKFTVTQSSGIFETNLIHQFCIYPNPAQDIIYIFSPKNSQHQQMQAELYSMEGKKIFQKKLQIHGQQKVSLLLEGVKTGKYILRLITNNGVVHQKLLVNRP